MDEYGLINIINLKNNMIIKKVLNHIINLLNKNTIIITGKNYKELVNMLKKTKYNYLYYEENECLFINLFIKNKRNI